MTKSTLLDTNESDNMDRVLYHFFKVSKALTYSEKKRFRLSKPFGTRVRVANSKPFNNNNKKTPSSQNLCCCFATFLFVFSIAIIPPDHLINCINFGCLLEFPLSLCFARSEETRGDGRVVGAQEETRSSKCPVLIDCLSNHFQRQLPGPIFSRFVRCLKP